MLKTRRSCRRVVDLKVPIAYLLRETFVGILELQCAQRFAFLLGFVKSSLYFALYFVVLCLTFQIRTKTTFTRDRTNLGPAEIRPFSTCLHGTVQILVPFYRVFTRYRDEWIADTYIHTHTYSTYVATNMAGKIGKTSLNFSKTKKN